MGGDRAPNRARSATLDLDDDTGLTHAVQEFYKLSQTFFFEAMNIRFQFPMTDKFLKKRSVAAVGRVETTQPSLDIRDRSHHLRIGRGNYDALSTNDVGEDP